jgi:uncharacterized protein (TIGR03435 family)
MNYQSMRLALAWILAGVFALAQGQTFEVASVKPSPPVPPSGGVYFGPPRGGPGTPDPEQITWTYAQMKSLLTTAYDVKPYQINGPAWLDSERYDIAVKIAPSATKEQVSVMWQNLLAERFGLKAHHESKEFQVSELVVGKDGHKLKATVEDMSLPLPPGPPQRRNGELLSPGFVATIFPDPTGTHAHAVARAQGLTQLTAMMGNVLGHPVLDKTGLTGFYDFSLDFSLPAVGPPGPPVPGDTAASEPMPNLPDAVQRELGLRLVPAKAQLDVVVIDKLEKVPSEN